MEQLNRGNQFGIKLNAALYSFPKNFTYDDILALRKNEEIEKYLVDRGSNLVVEDGLEQIIDLLIDASDSGFTHNSTGSGTNTPASSDADLQTPIARITITNRYRSGLSALFDTFWSTADGAGTWNETGLHTASSGGIMLCRRKFASSFIKNSSNTALIAWSVTVAAVAD